MDFTPEYSCGSDWPPIKALLAVRDGYMHVCSQREPKSWTSMTYNDEVAANALMKRITINDNDNYLMEIKPFN